MKNRIFSPYLVLGLVCAASIACKPIGPGQEKAFVMNEFLGTGINLGNALEAGPDWDWRLPLEESFFREIKAAGFDSVRIPVRWSAYAKTETPFTIDPDFFEKVDWAIDQSLNQKLAVVVNMHHYLELFENPAAHQKRFLALWAQIAERFKSLPETVFFEPLNEPNNALTPELWNELIPKVVEVIQESNPNRTLVIDVAHWSNVEYTPRLELPENDHNLIASFHYYNPHTFTHQSTPWSEPKFRKLSGIEWLGTDAEKEAVTRDLSIASEWASKNNRPLYLGEFGAYRAADMASRVRWTRFVADEARRLGMSVAYWEFGASFGLYDLQTGKWREELLDAVLPDD
ncbi:MAG: glycoside hydrolase family 5 protein [Verrucomicrobiae bacterium]|nr:glycoside hydrolase family 5 protein [Verrucomicrobiae bacterium]